MAVTGQVRERPAIDYLLILAFHLGGVLKVYLVIRRLLKFAAAMLKRVHNKE
jgi:hypothetical protein